MRALAVLFFVATIVAFADVAGSQQSTGINPNDLVGEWHGLAQAATGGSVSVYLTIKQIRADEASGTIYIQGGRRYHNRDLPFTANITGSRLSASSVPTVPGELPLSFDLEISDDAKTMSGWGEGGGTRSSLTFSKKK